MQVRKLEIVKVRKVGKSHSNNQTCTSKKLCVHPLPGDFISFYIDPVRHGTNSIFFTHIEFAQYIVEFNLALTRYLSGGFMCAFVH